jgi:predicted house-cleaning NTP pyrophosphatase (Maf/HAM1 superfamily)
MKYIKIMVDWIILASKSNIRKKILEENQITCRVEPSNVDEDTIKESLLKEQITPKIVSKNLAELKANKISQKYINEIVLGADSVIDLDGEIISKPKDRTEALEILKKLKGVRKKVLYTSTTCHSPVLAASYAGLEPVFVDISLTDFLMEFQNLFHLTPIS